MNEYDDIEIDFDDGVMAVTQKTDVNPQEVLPPVEPEDKPTVPTDFLSYLASTVESEYQRMFDFALDTLHFANKVQVYHWTCEKGFYHTQFEEIYGLLRNFADTLVETTLSYSKEKFTFISKNYSQQPIDFNIETAIMKLEEYRDAADGTSKSMKLNRSITNLFDDMICNLDKHIGLLKNFQ